MGRFLRPIFFQERESLMRFLIGILMLWGFVAFLILSERIPLPRGIFSGGLFTYLILRRAKDDTSFQQWRNRWRRWWGRIKLEFKHGWQRSFSQRRGRERYAIASEGLTEEQIRTWVADEMRKERARYGLAVDYRFLAKPEEIEERARKQAVFYAKTARFFFFVKVAWMSDSFQKSYIIGLTKGLIEKMSNRYGEVLAHEIAENALSVPGDSCVFYPKIIREKWMNTDFDKTFSPELITRTIAQHEYRHCAQLHALRTKGGAALVNRVIQHMMSTEYGEDVLEYDAYRYEFGEERSIDEFLKEAMIEVEWRR